MHSLQPQQNAQLRPRGHDENILEEAYRGRYARQRLLNFWPESSCGYHAIKRFVCIIQVTRCLIRHPGIRPAKSERSETISPSKLPRSLRPRKVMTSLAPKHNVPWLRSSG